MSEDLARYYRVLDLEPGASAEAIKEAYRDLAYVWHPDRFPDDERRREKATEKLKEINAAYQKLRSLERTPRVRTPEREPVTAAARASSSTADLSSDGQEELRRAAEAWQRSAWRNERSQCADRERRGREDEISRLAAQQEQREREQRNLLELKRLRTSRCELAWGLAGAGCLVGVAVASALHLSGVAWAGMFCLAAGFPPALGLKELLRQSEAIRNLQSGDST